MRLTAEQYQAIRRAAREAFGEEAGVRLFGSRVDDNARGGDFDLYIETQETDPERIETARRLFLERLHGDTSLADEPIDVVIHCPLHTTERAIDRVARREGVPL